LRGAAKQRLQRIAATLEGDVFKLGQPFAQFENLELNLRRRAGRRRRAVELVRTMVSNTPGGPSDLVGRMVTTAAEP
jgi:hypothetical protein